MPQESVARHAGRNHFSRWLKARTEFALAHELRPRRLSDYQDAEGLRNSLITTIARYRREQSQVLVTDFDREDFDLSGDFYRLGGGSLGGKARGLAFVRRMLGELGLRDRFEGVEIAVPETAVLGTDTFDRFLAANDLNNFAIECDDDAEIQRRFLAARFPEEAERDVAAFLEKAGWPLAVRSSSLLEDSQHQPFTGVYETLMLPNNDWSLSERLERALVAIKRVYASTFSQHAKAYLRATPYRLEEEKMAVLLQRIVGSAAGRAVLPGFLRGGALAQLLPHAAHGVQGRHRGGGAGDGAHHRGGRRLPPVQPEAPAPHPAVLLGGGDPGDHPEGVLGPAPRRREPRTGACARRSSTSRSPRRTARSWRSARPTPRRTTSSTTGCRGPGHGW